MKDVSGSVGNRPGIVVEFTLPGGEVLTRSWSTQEAMAGNVPNINDVLPWTKGNGKRWDHPQDPITFTADVKPGCEEAVRAWLGM